MNILETEAFTTGKKSSLYLLIVIFLTLDPLASVARNHRDEFIYLIFCPLCSFMCRARTEFIFNLATFPLPELLPTLHSTASAVRSHPHYPSEVAAQSFLWLCGSGLYTSYFCYFLWCVWKESKNTFPFSQLLMALCHGITLWSNYMNSFISCSSWSCRCAMP